MNTQPDCGRAWLATLGGGLAASAALVLGGCDGDSSKTASALTVTPAAVTRAAPEAGSEVFVVERQAEDPLTIYVSITPEAGIGSEDVRWDFGDGAESALGATQHRYAEGGEYTVTLEWSDATGKSRRSTTHLTVNDPPRVRVASAGLLPGTDDMGFRFRASASDRDSEIDPASWKWSFGDGGEGEGAEVEHIYAREGRFSVTVSVRDSDGARGVDEVVATVVRKSAAAAVAALTVAEPDARESAPRPELAGDLSDIDDTSLVAAQEEREQAGRPTTPVLPEVTALPEMDRRESDDEDKEEAVNKSADLFAEFGRLASGTVAGTATAMIFDFNVPLEWMDGFVLSLDGRREVAYEGGGALLIDLNARGDLSAALERLKDVLQFYAGSPRVYARWRQLWDQEVAIDITRLRPSLEANAALLEKLGTEQRRFFWEIVERLEALPFEALPTLAGGTWHCFEVGLVPSTPGKADGRVTLSFGGLPLMALENLRFPSESVLGEPLMTFFEAATWIDAPAEFTWVDTLQFDTTPIGCGGFAGH